MLEAFRLNSPKSKFYQAKPSKCLEDQLIKMDIKAKKLNLNPDPYGCAKVFAFNLVKHYRYAYNLFCSNGILFNHESPRRGANL